MKQTYEGTVGYAQGVPSIFIHGRSLHFPDFFPYFPLVEAVGQRVRVSIEVEVLEPPTLKQRIEKIIDENFRLGYSVQRLKQDVLAEIDKEANK